MRNIKNKAFKRLIIRIKFRFRSGADNKAGVENGCNSTSSASISRDMSIDMAGRSGFIKANIFLMTQPGFCQTK